MMLPEARLQSRCRAYLKDALPAPGWFSAISHERKQSVRSGQRQKAMGVKRGLSDLMVWYRGKFLAVELKVDSPVSENQKLFGAAMVRNEFSWAVIRSVVSLHDHLVGQGVPIAPSMRIAAMRADAALAVAEPAVSKPKRPSKPRVPRPSSKALAVGRVFHRPPK